MLPNFFAFLDAPHLITAGFAKSPENTNGFTVRDVSGRLFPLTSVLPQKTDRPRRHGKIFVLELADEPDICGNLAVEKDGYAPAFVIPRLVLDSPSHGYFGNDLGALWQKAKTRFRLWAPTALSVELCLFSSAGSKEPSEKCKMKRDKGGTWSYEMPGDQDGRYYCYRVTRYEKGKAVSRDVPDPYSRGASADSQKSLVFDPRRADPPGWENDSPIPLKHPVDAVVAETHLRDLTSHTSSGVPEPLRGKYAGLFRENTISPGGRPTGFDHLKALDITHLELLPTYTYASGDKTQAPGAYSWYNWGYDPVLYNVPEGSYASSAEGTAGISEYKQMVMRLHSHGIGLVFDAVFNHTFQTGDGPFSIFDKIVPGYFYRTNDDGTYSNGSGCGNDVASERPMVRKFIKDSVRYWMSEFHLDGIRFDLMGLLDKTTVKELGQIVKKINPCALFYGEAWNIPTLLSEDQRANQRGCAETGIAGAFNDGFRDDVRGGFRIDSAKGFSEGGGASSARRFASELKGCSMGPDGIPLYSPNQTVNYISCHDDLDLTDRIAACTPRMDENERLRMQALAFAVMLTAQGIPFFLLGDEFCRTKKENPNTYNNNDPDVNPIDWSRLDRNETLFAYCRNLIALRKAHPAFRMAGAAQVSRHMRFDILRKDRVQFTLSGHANGDAWQRIGVFYNGSCADQTFFIPGKWGVVARELRVELSPFAEAAGHITVPPLSAVILCQKK